MSKKDNKLQNPINNDSDNGKSGLTGRFRKMVEDSNGKKQPRSKRDDLIPLDEKDMTQSSKQDNAKHAKESSTKNTETATNKKNTAQPSETVSTGETYNVSSVAPQESKYAHTGDENRFNGQKSTMMPINPYNNNRKPVNAHSFDRSSYGSNSDDPARGGKKHRNIKKIAISAGCAVVAIVAVLGIGYVATANSYDGKFLPKTSINGTNVAGLTVDEAFNKAGENIGISSTDVTDNGTTVSITGNDISMQLNKDQINEILDSQNKWDWLKAQFGPDNDTSVETTYDTEKLEQAVDSLPCVTDKTRTDPVNSTVTYSSSKKEFVATESSIGTKIDRNEILEAVTKCVENGGGKIDTEQFFEYPKYTEDSNEIKDAINTANTYIDKTITFNIDGINNAESLDIDDLSGMVTVDDNLNVNIDETAISAWLKEIGKKYDTAGTERDYTTAYGKTTTLPAGTSTFGWVTDEASTLPVVVDDIKSNEKTINSDFKYSQTANGPKGGDEWGSNYIDIDKQQQKVRVIKDGEVIFEAETVTGTNTPEKDTPTGIWTVLDKQTNYTMVGETDPKTGQPEYRTPCDYWIRFTWSGCGFHDAEWRGRWSSTEWLNGNGSHGCANMHLSDVKQLYSLCSVGMPVLIHM